MKKKTLISLLILTLLISTIPVACMAATKAPKKTTITSITANGSKVSLKWKKISKCYGYKVYRSINGGARKCVKTFNARTVTKYTDTVPSFISGTVKYQVATYNKVKVKRYYNTSRKEWVANKPKAKDWKTKKVKYAWDALKKFSSAKTVSITATKAPIDPSVTKIDEKIYQEYSQVDIDELSLDTVRELILYKLNDIRKKEGVKPVKYDPYVNQVAQNTAAKYTKYGANKSNTDLTGDFHYDLRVLTGGIQEYCNVAGKLVKYIKLEDEQSIDVKTIIYEWLENTMTYCYGNNTAYWDKVELVGVGYDGTYCVIGFAIL